MPSQILVSAVSLLIGMFGGMLGAYVGMKVGIARLEEWRFTVDRNLTKLDSAAAIFRDDILVLDIEVDRLMASQKMERTRRQWNR